MLIVTSVEKLFRPEQDYAESEEDVDLTIKEFPTFKNRGTCMILTLSYLQSYRRDLVENCSKTSQNRANSLIIRGSIFISSVSSLQ